MNNNNSLKKYNNLLISDYFKISHLKSVIVSGIIMAVLIVINYATLWFQASMIEGADIPSDIIISYTFTGKSMLFGSTSYINLGLFIAIICGIFIGGEFRDGTVKTTVARGADRLSLYFGKWLSIVTLTIVYVLSAFLFCGILTAISGYGVAFTGEEFGLLMRSLALQVWVSIASASVYICIAFLARTQGATIGISLGLYFLVAIVAAILMLIASIVGESAEWLNTLVELVPSQQLANACSYGPYETADLLKVIFVPLAYILATCGLGVMTFLKRDIK